MRNTLKVLSFGIAIALLGTPGALGQAANYVLDNGGISTPLNASDATEPRDNWFANEFTAQAGANLITRVDFYSSTTTPGSQAEVVLYQVTGAGGNPALGATVVYAQSFTPPTGNGNNAFLTQIQLIAPVEFTVGSQFLVAIFMPDVIADVFPYVLDTSGSATGSYWDRSTPGTFNLDNISGAMPVNELLAGGSWAPGAGHLLIRAYGVPVPGSVTLVSNAADSGPGSLRAALASATNGVIIVATGVSGTITLTNGQLNVSNSVTILGPGPGALTVSGNNASCVFNTTGTNVTISGLTIANGSGALYGAGISAGGSPGSIVAINNCVVTNNSTTLDGGGICNNAGVTMTVSNCTISGNSAASGLGGGIYNSDSTLTVVNSTLRGNSASLGGGIFNDAVSGPAALTVAASTLNNNSANYGGGIYNHGPSADGATLTIVNSTLSGNSADGCINNDGAWGGLAVLTINASTFSGNSGIVIYNDGRFGGSATLEIGDTILNAGAAGGSIYYFSGTITSDGYNLSSDDGGGFLTATGDQINTAPMLGPLQNNGGPTWTCALLPGSPAIDQGKTNAVPGLACTTDQRGFPRPCDNPNLANAPGGDGSDIGAFEVQYLIATSTADSGPGTLRTALATAGNVDIIDASGVSGTITLTNGELAVSNSVTILGPGPGALTVSGNHASRVFHITGTNVTISRLTVANGNGAVDGAGIRADSPCSVLTVSDCVVTNNNALGSFGGGGIFNVRGVTMTITNCTISGNRATGSGGGIYNLYGVLNVDGSTLSGNSAASWGGGIFNDGSGSRNASLAVSASTLSGNWASDRGGAIDNDGYSQGQATLMLSTSTLSSNATANWGGGIFNDGYAGNAAVTINACTLSDNTASNKGGGIYSYGDYNGNATVTIGISTLSANSANNGGGIYNDGDDGSAALTINASTLSGNSATWGGGIYNYGYNGVSTLLEIGDTILNAGAAGGNITNYYGTVTSDGYNLSSDSGGGFLTATGDQINTNPRLGPLADYGGPTLTMLPLPGSPAIDAGNDSVTSFLATDQRGYPRLSGAHVDIGAVEAQWAPANLPPLLINSAWTAAGGARCFQFTFSNVTNADFTVLATTNLALPLPDWTMLAPAIQCSPGQYQFTDPGATNYPQCFYRVVSP
jgi:hypothetical protein